MLLGGSIAAFALPSVALSDILHEGIYTTHCLWIVLKELGFIMPISAEQKKNLVSNGC